MHSTKQTMNLLLTMSMSVPLPIYPPTYPPSLANRDPIEFIPQVVFKTVDPNESDDGNLAMGLGVGLGVAAGCIAMVAGVAVIVITNKKNAIKRRNIIVPV